jgi:hypothetical protein
MSPLPDDLEAIGLSLDDPRRTSRGAGDGATGIPSARGPGFRGVAATDRPLDEGSVRAELHPPPAAGRREGEVVPAVDADPVVVLLEGMRPPPGSVVGQLSTACSIVAPGIVSGSFSGTVILKSLMMPPSGSYPVSDGPQAEPSHHLW